MQKATGGGGYYYYKVIYAKFTQHEDLGKLLLGTGDAALVEDSPKDAFWGVGPRLGQLELVRTTLVGCLSL